MWRGNGDATSYYLIAFPFHFPRPRLGCRWDVEKCFDVLIDGKPTAPNGLEETTVIDLGSRAKAA
jgi:hypothetical protein